MEILNPTPQRCAKYWFHIIYYSFEPNGIVQIGDVAHLYIIDSIINPNDQTISQGSPHVASQVSFSLFLCSFWISRG